MSRRHRALTEIGIEHRDVTFINRDSERLREPCVGGASFATTAKSRPARAGPKQIKPFVQCFSKLAKVAVCHRTHRLVVATMA